MKLLLFGPVLFSLCSLLPHANANHISVCVKAYRDHYVKRSVPQWRLTRVRRRGGGLVGEQVPGLKPGYLFGEDCQPYLAQSPIAELCCDPFERPLNRACFEGIECCPNTGKWSCSIGDGRTYPCGDITITGNYGEACDCPQDDTKFCFDGSEVKRDPINRCEFPPCPDPPAPLCCDPYERPSSQACFEGIECCPNTGEWSCSIGDGITYPCGGITITGNYGEACDECPRDTKRCPDGTEVKRDPYDRCEFAPCQASPQLNCDDCPCGFFDGCNSCGCGNRNFPICTLASCSPDQLRPTTCDTCDTPSCGTCPCGYNDGCNDCLCEEGIPSCTERFCFWQGIPSCIEDCQCQDDRQFCLDGSSVTRDPENNCQFRPCPSTVCTLEVKTCPDGSFRSRDPFNGCAFPPCPVPNCCDPDVRPGVNGSPFCSDGAFCCEECCTWSCGIGDGTAPCGNVCGNGGGLY